MTDGNEPACRRAEGGQAVPLGGEALVTLIGSLEAAEGPDDLLDAEIACLLFGAVISIDPDDGTLFVELPTSQNPDGKRVPEYTRSLDAALTLVPEGKIWGIGRAWEKGEFIGFAAVCRNPGRIEAGDEDSLAPTAALALCIAALKARG